LNAAIITIGDELLRGSVCDTNSSWLANRLYKLGFPVKEIVSLPDEEQVISTKLKEISSQYSLLFVTGGLGPTSDDLTREAVASAFDLSLELNMAIVENIRKFFFDRGKDMPSTNKKQAMIPEGAVILNNLTGTAPGFRLSIDGSFVLCFPGVPSELQNMFDSSVVPWLVTLKEKENSSDLTISRTFNVCFIGESHLEEKIGHLATITSNPSLSYLCSPGLIALTIKSVAKSSSEAEKMLDELEKSIRREIGDLIRGNADEKLVDSVLRVLSEKGKYIYIRDVITGGLLGAVICNAIYCSKDKFSASLFAGSLVLGGLETSPNDKNLFDSLVVDSKSELEMKKNRIEIVLAPHVGGAGKNSLADKSSSSVVRWFIGSREFSTDFKIAGLLSGHNASSSLVNTSLGALYQMIASL